MTERMKTIARGISRRAGLDIVRYPKHDPEFRVSKLLRRLNADLLIDVGANTGQYAVHVRRLGYTGPILSFEPLSSAFASLAKNASGDALWTPINLALGKASGTAEIHIARNSASSSLLPMLQRHLDAAPYAKPIGSEQIEVRTLDEVFPQFAATSERAFLKVDAQGFEREIVEGASQSLSRLVGIQLELSLQQLYEGQMLFGEMFDLMRSLGFRLQDIWPGFTDPRTSELLQVDGVFLSQ